MMQMKKFYLLETQPIGIYENNNLSIALNLAGNLKTESFDFKINEKIKIKKNYKKNVVELKSFILGLIIIMFLVDMLINIILKNNILFLKLFKKNNVLSIFFLCLFFYQTKIN